MQRSKDRRTRITIWIFSLLIVASMALGMIGTLAPPSRATPTPIPTQTPFPTRTPTPVPV